MERFKDYEQLPKYIKNGYIRVQKHPALPLKIYNYTQKTQFENMWDNITLHCRGLVLDEEGSLVIKCVPKFFNLNEPFAPKLNLNECLFFQKLDGYYISIKKDSKYGLIVTSRGSFDTKYANAARELLDDQTIKSLKPNYTYFCELCQNFPGDESIIVAKHPTPKLVCWAVKNENFQEVENDSPFEKPSSFTLGYVEQELPKRKTEGVVALEPTTHQRLKIKTDWYLRMHKLISNCTPNRAYQIFKEHGRVEDLDIPDEFMPQMVEWQTMLETKLESEYQKYLKLLDKTEPLSDKELGLSKEFTPDEKSVLFSLRKDQTQRAIDLLIRRLERYLQNH